MPQISISVSGLDRLERKLRNASRVLDVAEPPLHRGGLRVQRRMQDYPPPPPRSRYIRTGTYGRRWTTRVERSRNQVRVRVGNNTSYAPLVGSSQFQARIHRGRWTTDMQALEQELPVIQRDLQRAIDEELAR
ncbi:MAG: hypothetical protein KatS3mg051_2129 [Anaerolineae bacterium]|nr:MAG: hypothetical protein KatS3mg051_2129 [Anaerolineae bacterium]